LLPETAFAGSSATAAASSRAVFPSEASVAARISRAISA
jgi:hypothetical protein